MVNQDKVNSIVNMVRNLITAREMTEVLTNEAINALIDEVVNLGIPCTDEDLEAAVISNTDMPLNQPPAV